MKRSVALSNSLAACWASPLRLRRRPGEGEWLASGGGFRVGRGTRSGGAVGRPRRSLEADSSEVAQNRVGRGPLVLAAVETCACVRLPACPANRNQ